MFRMLASIAFAWLISAQEPPVSSFTLKSGETLRGQVMGVDGDKVALKLQMFGGSAETQRRLADFAPRSACDIKMAVAKPDSFEDHFKLAQFAVASGVLDVAGREAGRAKEIAEKDPKSAELMPQLAQWASGALETLFRESLAKNDLAKAEHFLQVLFTRLPDERTDVQKSALIDEMKKGEERIQQERAEREKTRQDEKADKDRDRTLAPIKKDLDEGNRLSREGLMQAKSQGKALAKFEDAIERYKAAWRATEKIQQSTSSDATLKMAAGGLAEQILHHGIEAALSAAHVLTVRSDYKGALAYVNKVLSIDPDNAEAKDLRKTIEVASSSGWGWGWGWGYGSGVTTPAR